MGKILKVQTLRGECPLIFKSCMQSQPITVTHLGRIQKTYTIDFDVVLSNGVCLQRDFCWTLEQKQSLIESVIKGINIPPICCIIGGENDTVMRIIDGKQRLSTLISFFNNQFPLTVDGEDYYYDDLDLEGRLLFKSFDIKAYIVYEPIDDDGTIHKFSDCDLISWFNTINFSGTQQDISHRNKLLSYLK